MDLIDLINSFNQELSFEDFCKEQSLSITSEVIEIYMQKPFKIESEIFFFEIEETNGLSKFEREGEIYYNLFDFYYFQDVIQDNNESSNSLSSEQLAEVLLNYAINDA